MAGIPGFFVIGAPRSGTTALYRYLEQHPALHLGPVKEPSFFACGEAAIEVVGADAAAADVEARARSVLTWADYRALYADAPAGTLLGDASPTYLYLPHVPAVVARHVPDAKLVAVLRQPAERAWSHLNADAGGGVVTGPDLVAALEAEERAPRTTFVGRRDYLRPSRYGAAVGGWLDRFPTEQLHLVRHEDLLADPGATVQGIFAFLGVDPDVAVDTSLRYNVSGPTRLLSVTTVIRRLRRHAHLLPAGVHRRAARLRAKVSAREQQDAPLDPGIRRTVTDRWFVDDLTELHRRTGFDLSGWLAGEPDAS